MAIYFLCIFFFLAVSYDSFIFLIVFFYQSYVRSSLYNTWLNELNLAEVALQRLEKRKKRSRNIMAFQICPLLQMIPTVFFKLDHTVSFPVRMYLLHMPQPNWTLEDFFLSWAFLLPCWLIQPRSIVLVPETWLSLLLSEGVFFWIFLNF